MNTKETLEDIKLPNQIKLPKKKPPKQQQPVQKSKKKKYIMLTALIFGIIIIIITIVLLVAHFKYNLFDSEIYRVAKIKRDVNSVEYFTETKKIQTKLAYTSGELEEIENFIETNFLVMVTNKKELLNTAYLVIINSKTEMKDKEASLNSFNIFDEKTVKEFEENPDGSKYPMSVFHFYENGTIKDINLPKEMRKEDAQNMIDLINNVVPKLTRNKTEDYNNGVIIKTKNDKKKKAFTENEIPKEFTDKYTNSRFKGSKIVKDVEREVENDKISEIRANTSLFLETQKEEENKNFIDLGIKNFYYNSSSKIILTQIQKDKIEDVNLVKRLSSKLNFIDSEKLIQIIIENETEKQNNLKESISSQDTQISESQLRNLEGAINWEGSFSFCWEIIKSNILGQDANIGYFVELGDGKITKGLSVTVGSFTFKIGKGRDLNPNNKSGSDKDDGTPIAKIPLVGLAVTLTVKIGGSFSYGADLEKDILSVQFSGSLLVKAGLEIGLGNVASIEAGARGDLITVTFSTSFKKNWDLTFSKYKISLKAIAGKVSVYAIAKVWIWTVFDTEYEVFKGFPVVEITW